MPLPLPLDKIENVLFLSPTPTFYHSPLSFSWTNSFHFYTASTFSLSTASARSDCKVKLLTTLDRPIPLDSLSLLNPPLHRSRHTHKRAYPCVLSTNTKRKILQHTRTNFKSLSHAGKSCVMPQTFMPYVCLQNASRSVGEKLPTDKNDFFDGAEKPWKCCSRLFFDFFAFLCSLFYVTGAWSCDS